MIKKIKTLIAGGIANTFEWYDYALFGHLAIVIGSKFSPSASDDNLVSSLEAFFVFAIGYIMRPLGGVVFGVIGDKFGRKTSLGLSIICMAFPTITLGLLPTYAEIGITATAIMILARMVQGLSMGGALVGSIAFNIEHTAKNRHGFVGSISMAGICLGILLGSLVCTLVRGGLSVEQFNNWGWRLPFVFGFFIFGVGIYIRKYVDETPTFENTKKMNKLPSSPLSDVFKHHWLDMLMSILINSTGSVIFYMCTIFALAFLDVQGWNKNDISWLSSGCYILMTIITLLAGWFSDIFGRRKVFLVNLVILILSAPFIVKALESGSAFGIVIAQIILSILAAWYIGPEPALQAEFYPANVRSTALSLSYNAATTIFGGITPYILMWIFSKNGNLFYATLYIEFCALISLIGLYFYKDRSDTIVIQ